MALDGIWPSILPRPAAFVARQQIQSPSFSLEFPA
jgi:hypothetical protein